MVSTSLFVCSVEILGGLTTCTHLVVQSFQISLWKYPEMTISQRCISSEILDMANIFLLFETTNLFNKDSFTNWLFQKYAYVISHIYWNDKPGSAEYILLIILNNHRETQCLVCVNINIIIFILKQNKTERKGSKFHKSKCF